MKIVKSSGTNKDYSLIVEGIDLNGVKTKGACKYISFFNRDPNLFEIQFSRFSLKISKKIKYHKKIVNWQKITKW